MRNLLALAAFCALAFGGAGYFLGWYKVQTTTAADGSTSVTITFNNKKISVDVDKGRDYLQEKIKAAEETEKKTAKAEETGPRAQR